MISLMFTVMFSALSLAQPDRAAITTNELPPPAGMSAGKAPAAADKAADTGKAPQAAAARTPSQSAEKGKKEGVGEKVAPGSGNKETPPASAGAEAAQPTAEEKQAPTQKEAGGSGSPGRIAAFWFILPNRTQGNK